MYIIIYCQYIIENIKRTLHKTGRFIGILYIYHFRYESNLISNK